MEAIIFHIFFWTDCQWSRLKTNGVTCSRSHSLYKASSFHTPLHHASHQQMPKLYFSFSPVEMFQTHSLCSQLWFPGVFFFFFFFFPITVVWYWIGYRIKEMKLYLHLRSEALSNLLTLLNYKKGRVGSGWCSSVDWVPDGEPKGCWFDSQPGHMPGLWARSLAQGAWEATTHWCSHPCLLLPLPSVKIIN